MYEKYQTWVGQVITGLRPIFRWANMNHLQLVFVSGLSISWSEERMCQKTGWVRMLAAKQGKFPEAWLYSSLPLQRWLIRNVFFSWVVTTIWGALTDTVEQNVVTAALFLRTWFSILEVKESKDTKYTMYPKWFSTLLTCSANKKS